MTPCPERAKFLTVWNTHSRIAETIAQSHIEDLSKFTPPVSIFSKYIPTTSLPPSPANGTLVDLDTPDEEAIRSLIMGIVHRTLGDLVTSRAFLEDSVKRHSQVKCSTWVCGVALFELAVLDLKEAEEATGKHSSEPSKGEVLLAGVSKWSKAIESAKRKLDRAMSVSGKEVDLSSRLDSRVMMLRDEIELKQELIMGRTTLKSG